MMLQGAEQMTVLLEGVRNLTLTGALVVAVVTLWKSSTKKDDQLLESTKAVTVALTAAASSNQELRNIIEGAIQSNDELRDSIKELRVEINRNFKCAVVEDEGHVGEYGQHR